MNEILVALDLSEHSEAVLSTATELAGRLGARLTILHVAAPDPDFVGFEAGPQTTRDTRAHALRDEHRRIQEWAEQRRARGLEVRALLIQEPTVEGILGEAARSGADLIVVGSHSRGVLARALLGSVSQGVLREASCPVLVVPRKPAESSPA